MADRVLITTDDLEHAVPINGALEAAGLDTSMVSSLDDVRQAVRGQSRNGEPAAIVLTGGLYETTAQRLLAAAREHSVSTLGLVEPTDEDPAQIGRALGLTGWLVKPADPAEVVATVRRLIERRRLQQRTGILGEAPPIQEVLVKIEQMAPVTSTVLIEGESGTGKELVARGIHELSPRHGQAFIAVNCAALPETLLESELFGHEKGSFTGAAERRLGRFELADGGTILLDEVGEMPASTQVKLLRVLEDRSFFRVGGTHPIKVDVRVIAATNKSLKEAVTLGRFRDDLYYRLNVLSLYLPPLRERRSDIPLLARTFIDEFARAQQRPFKGITPEAMQILVEADWPGNVRQLRNLIESMVVLAPENEIRPSDIPRDIRERSLLLPARIPTPNREIAGHELEFIFRSLVELKLQVEEMRRRIEERPPERVEVIEVGTGEGGRGKGTARIAGTMMDPLDATVEPEQPVIYRPGMTMADVERAAIDAALRETRGNRRKAAEVLGIGERTLYRKLKDYALS
jgi:DNA-binding NtrC family response regulator